MGTVLSARILDAARDCVARVGVSKTTLDDVAREAGCSRATLYRHFAGTGPLFEALIQRDLDRLDRRLAVATADLVYLADVCAAVLTTGVEFVLDHAALTTVLAVEPTVLLSAVSFDGSELFFARARALIAPHLWAHVGSDAERLAELLARIAISHLSSPRTEAPISDPEVVQHLVRTYVVPGFVREPTSERVQP